MYEIAAPDLSVDVILDAIVDRKDWSPLEAAVVRRIILDVDAAFSCEALEGRLAESDSRVAMLDGLSSKHVYGLYDTHFVPRRSAGRRYYDELKTRAFQGRCLYCQLGVADTLDHFLPKSLYPFLCVSPVNLVPCCQRCNKKLLDAAPKVESEVLLHPFFDRLPEGRWLHARLVGPDQPGFHFMALPPHDWPSLLRERVINTFTALDLAEALIPESGRVVARVGKRLGRFEYLPDRMQELRWQLQECLEVDPNSVDTAVVECLALSEWFAATGYAMVQMWR